MKPLNPVGRRTFGDYSRQITRNQLTQRWKCGKRVLQALEDVAIDLIPDFRNSLLYPQVIGYRHRDGSISARLRRCAQLQPYHVWVLEKLLKLRRRDYDQFEARAFKLRNRLSMENFNG